MLLQAQEILARRGLLEDNKAILLGHKNAHVLAYAIFLLEDKLLFTQDLFNRLVIHDSPDQLAIAWIKLSQAELSTPENLDFLCRSQQCQNLSQAFLILHGAELLCPAYQLHLSQHPRPISLAHGLKLLEQAKINHTASQKIIFEHPQLVMLKDAMELLDGLKILNWDNFIGLAAQKNLENLLVILKTLMRRGLLTASNYAAITQTEHAILLHEAVQTEIWSRLPEHRLSQELLRRLYSAARSADPMHALTTLRDQVLGATGAAIMSLNSAQSTHMASVHASVSTSARNLYAIYGRDLDVDLVLVQVLAIIDRSAPSAINDAAKRGLERIMTAELAFVDPGSKISIAQLLAVAYLALQDDSRRIGTVHDAETLLVEGLYEMQRGYNLSADGWDDGAADDLPICAAGSFNKIMEKLTGVHEAVELSYVSHVGAQMKAPRVIDAAVVAYLTTAAQVATRQEFLAFRQLLNALQQDGTIAAIWGKVRQTVAHQLWDEFHCAYADHPADARFQALLDYGSDRQLPSLDAVEAVLMTSLGYQSYQRAGSGLFARSPEKDDEMACSTKMTCVMLRFPSK